MKRFGETLVIKSGAIFIADAHFMPEQRQEFSALINRLKAFSYRQVILLGDFFAALFGDVSSSQAAYLEQIKEIDRLNHQVIIFEGNHDFNLSALFKKARVIKGKLNEAIFLSSFYESAIFLKPQSRAKNLSTEASGDLTPAHRVTEASVGLEQFVASKNLRFNKAGLKNFKVIKMRGFVQHGDVFLPFLTAVALNILQSKIFLKIANLFDFKGWIFARILNAQRRKQLYKRLDNFKQISSLRLKNLAFKDAIVIEGHFHQGETLYLNINGFSIKYVNLAAFVNEANLIILKQDLRM